MKKSLLLVPALFCSVGMYAQQSIEFNYAEGDLRQWGTSRAESYDVAIRLSDPTLTGSRITAFELPLEGSDAIADCRLWMSTTLTLDDKKVNVPDIMVRDVEVTDGKLSVTLDTPYVIPAEGVCLGCSFTVTEVNEKTAAPLTVGASENPDAFMVHSSRKYLKWGNYNLALALDMTVALEGDFHAEAVRVAGCSESGAPVGETFIPTFTIRNQGQTEVSDIDYTITFGEEVVSQHHTFEPPLPMAYASDVEVSGPALALGESGEWQWRVSIDKVNGVPDAIEGTGVGTVHAYPYVPEHRPLMEEYTGTWCGWCPRGALGMSLMRAKYGDRFVGVAYHTGDDPMVTDARPTTDYDGAPWGVLDRRVNADPYYGHLTFTDDFNNGIGAAWSEVRDEIATVDLTGSVDWSDGTRQALTVDVTAKFMRNYHECDLRWVYMLTADGLTREGKDWMQSNYFSGMAQYDTGDLRSLYERSRYITDFIFDDVLVYSPDVFGEEGSLPDEVTMLTPYESEVSIPLEKAVNTVGTPLVDSDTQLNVVVAVVDGTTNRVLNALRLPVGEGSGIDMPASDKAEVVSTEWYDLTGRRVPESAVCTGSAPLLRVDTLSDGSRRPTLRR